MDRDTCAGVSEADRDIIAEGWLSDEASRLVRDLTDIGGRFAGSPEEKAAVDLLKNRMADIGLAGIRAEEFEYTGWKRGRISLETTHPRACRFEALALPHSPASAVEGELVYLGYGTPGEFRARAGQLEGKIVMIDAKSPHYVPAPIHRKEKYRRAVEEKAAGVLWMRDQGGHLEETGSLYAGCQVPAAGISQETGQRILRLGESRPVRLRLKMENRVEKTVSWNVVGELPGRGDADRLLVAGAHFDGHDIAQGALDNAAGVAIMLEAARLLARHRDLLGRGIRFICFSAEELGLIGSRAYVDQEESQLDRIDFMLNLDGAGRGGVTGLGLQDWPELIPHFRSLLANMRMPLLVDVALRRNSDMYPFTLKGVPSGYIRALDERPTGRNWGHTSADTFDKVSKLNLRMDAILTARLLLQASAFSGEWPARRYSGEEIRERFG